MSKKAMIISQGSEFMVDSLTANLRKAEMEVSVVEPLPEKVGPEMFDSDVVLIYAGDYVSHVQRALMLVCDHCTEEDKPMCIIGYESDIQLVESFISAQLIACKFVRPFDMKMLADKVKRLAEAEHDSVDKKSILLVDDDATFLKTLLRFLSEKYDVTAVRAGHHALKFLETHTPDLILLDYDMPVMSGPQTFDMIKKIPGMESVPVMFLTGASDRESVVTAMQLRPDGYLLKNMGKNELVDAIRNMFVSLRWKKVR